MLPYLDNCCFNRPYDDQSHHRINLETQAKLYVQKQILSRRHSLIWSYILQFENDQNPYIAHKCEIAKWKKLAQVLIPPSDEIITHANSYRAFGLHTKDALHYACAIAAKADFFLTTDKHLINKASAITGINVVNPLRFIEIEEEFS